MQFLRGYRGRLKNLKTAGGKTVNEPYNLCRISIAILHHRDRIYLIAPLVSDVVRFAKHFHYSEGLVL